jgi:hypothetical protein
MDALELLTRERHGLAEQLKALATDPPSGFHRRHELRRVAHRLHALAAVERHYLLTEARLEGLAEQTDGQATYQAMELLLAELKDAPPDGEQFEAVLRGLSLLNERRLRDLAAVFPELARHLGRSRLDLLGEEMASSLETLSGEPYGEPSPPRGL